MKPTKLPRVIGFRASARAGRQTTMGMVEGGTACTLAVSPLATIPGGTTPIGVFLSGRFQLVGIAGDTEIVLLTGVFSSPIELGTEVASYHGNIRYDAFKAIVVCATDLSNAVFVLGSSDVPADTKLMVSALQNEYAGTPGYNAPLTQKADTYGRALEAWYPAEQQRTVGISVATVGPHIFIPAPAAVTDRIHISEMDLSYGSGAANVGIFTTTPGLTEIYRTVFALSGRYHLGPAPHALVLPVGQGLLLTLTGAVSTIIASAHYYIVSEQQKRIG